MDKEPTPVSADVVTSVLLIALVMLFAVVNGLNDGAAVTAAALKAPGLRPLTTIIVFAGALIVVPLIVGTGVARTLRSGLLDGEGASLTAAIVVGVLAATVVIAVLAVASMPTSLTLGVVGGIVGAGVGLGLDPLWPTIARVAAIGVAAPVVGGLLGLIFARVPVGRNTTSLRRLHGGGVLIQAAAYAANDGQKMMAVGIVAASASGLSGQGDQLPVVLLALIAVCFSFGAVAGLRPVAGSLGGGVLRQRPRDEISVEFASGVAVLGSAAFGAPVSMTQSIAGGLVGVGVNRGNRQVRWRVAASLALAWIVTLPVSAAVGALGGVIVSWAGT